MNCHDAQSLLGDYALGLLDEAQRVELENHLATGCTACQRELSVMNQDLGSLIESEPLLSPRTALKASILDRIESARVTVRKEGEEATSSTTHRAHGWHLLAAGLAAVAVGVSAYSFLNGNQRARNAADAQRLAVAEWQKQIDGTEREFGLVGTTLVSLPISRVQQGPVSHVLIDEVTNQLHVWTKPFSEGDPSVPNWVWVLDAQDQVLGHSALEPKGDRFGAVVDVAKADRPTRCRLLLTQEATPPGSQPGDEVLEDAAFEVR